MNLWRLLFSPILLAALASCGRAPSSSVPASAAYSDGFEVVVFDLDTNAAAVNVRSLPLREAEQAVMAGSRALLPGDPSAVEQKLPAGKFGDSLASIAVQPLDGGKQRVRLIFQESTRTYVYEYLVDQNNVTPIASEYRDLARSTKVTYSNE